MTTPAPRVSVVLAFGASGTPFPLEGGQGSTWRVGEVVFKRLDLTEENLAWQAELFASLVCDGFRIAQPLRAEDGSLVVDGWCAWQAVQGRREERRWPEIIAVGDRFHAALINVPRPGFIGRRADPWAIGDRVAWGELAGSEFSDVKHFARLASALRSVAAPGQLIHGDLTGNVLFDDSLPPAVIDFSPYWRPSAFALAVVVADALVWEGADESVLNAVSHVDDFDQYLLRALIYRSVADHLLRLDEPIRPDNADPYLPAVELACQLAA